MLKQVMLIAALLVFVCELKSEGIDQEVQLICPDGWIAYQLHYYKCSYGSSDWTENCYTCLTCRRYSTLYHPFSFVELCVVFQPAYTTSKNYKFQTKICTDKFCNEFYYQPFCGLTLTMQNRTVTSKKVLPFQNLYPEAQNNTIKSVDFICPRSSSFKFLFERKINLTRTFSILCVLCNQNSEDNLSQEQMLITMCSQHFYTKENETHWFENKILSECQDKDKSKCAPDTIPPILKGLHCGSKFTALKYGHQVNISNYIPCTNGKTDTTLVGNASKLLMELYFFSMRKVKIVLYSQFHDSNQSYNLLLRLKLQSLTSPGF
jgi:hypothetical protein